MTARTGSNGDLWVMSYGPDVLSARIVAKAQLRGLHVSRQFHFVALIWGSFAEFCSQICSQLSASFLRSNDGQPNLH
jgi:hypothetical protein